MDKEEEKELWHIVRDVEKKLISILHSQERTHEKLTEDGEKLDAHIKKEAEMMANPWYKNKVTMSGVVVVLGLIMSWNWQAFEFVQKVEENYTNVNDIVFDVRHLNNEFDSIKDMVASHLESDIKLRQELIKLQREHKK